MKPSASAFSRLNTKLILSYSLLAIVAFAIIIVILFLNFRAQSHKQIHDQLEKLAALSALQIDGDAQAAILASGTEDSAIYREAVKRLHLQRVASSAYALYTMIKDEKGQMVIVLDDEADPSKLSPLGDIYDQPSPLLASNFSSMRTAIAEEDFYTDEFGTFMSGYAPLIGKDGLQKGIVGVDIDAGQIIADERRMLTIAVFVFLATIPVAILISIMTASIVTRPLAALSNAVRQIAQEDMTRFINVANSIAQGDFSRSVVMTTSAVRYHGKDELSDLAGEFNGMIDAMAETSRAFNRMSKNLSQLIGQITGYAADLNQASHRLAGNAEHAGKSAERINSSIKEIAAGANKQVESASQSEISIEHMGHSINDIAGGAKKQAEAVKKAYLLTTRIDEAFQEVAVSTQTSEQAAHLATEKAWAGTQAVAQTVQGMHTIKTGVETAAQKVLEMGQISKEIEFIVSTIQDIAAQTNMIALNAAIEAAHAGQSGKGFTVVAEEVRKLSKDSALSARQIRSLLRGIQTSVGKAVNTMQEGLKQVEFGTSSADQSDQALRTIVQAVESLNQQVSEIAAAVQQVKNSSNELVEAMESVSTVVDQNMTASEAMSESSVGVIQSVSAITEVSRQNNEAITGVSVDVQSINDQMEEVNSAAQFLESMAQTLHQSVSQFHLYVESAES